MYKSRADYYKSRYMRKTGDPRVGLRVEIPVSSDYWIRGARFGTIRSSIKQPGLIKDVDLIFVKMDHKSIRTHLCFRADMCRVIEGEVKNED